MPAKVKRSERNEGSVRTRSGTSTLNKVDKKTKLKVIPVTLLSGFLGAGKTTLLKRILENRDGLKVAVIVNDMAALNIDAELIKKTELVQVKEELIQLQNGCICCTLRTDLIREIKNIHSRGCHDYIIIESSGVAEPMQVAESFELDSTTYELPISNSNDSPAFVGSSKSNDITDAGTLYKIARLDTCVTVVDASTFHDVMKTSESIKERFNEGDEQEGEKKIGQLITEQIEFADVIILNKADLVSERQLEESRRILSHMNKTANVLTSTNSDVDIKAILNTGLYSREKAESAPGWLHDLKSGTVHKSETEEYNISSFVYRARRPFHPERLRNFIDPLFTFEGNNEKLTQFGSAASLSASTSTTYGWILRSKGFTWLASHPDLMIEWNNGGYCLQLNPAGTWFVSRNREEFEAIEPSVRDKIYANWSGEYGDKRQEIVFIGVGLNSATITSALDACLLTETEMADHYYWQSFPNTLLALPVHPGPWSEALVAGGMKKVTVSDEVELVVRNIAMYVPPNINTNAIGVQIFTINGKQKTLLATLRSGICDQFHGEFVFHSNVLFEIVPLNIDKQLQSSIVVHLTGTVLPTEDEHEDDQEDDHE